MHSSHEQLMIHIHEPASAVSLCYIIIQYHVTVFVIGTTLHAQKHRIHSINKRQLNSLVNYNYSTSTVCNFG